jgi:hypothetical protein
LVIFQLFFSYLAISVAAIAAIVFRQVCLRRNSISAGTVYIADNVLGHRWPERTCHGHFERRNTGE